MNKICTSIEQSKRLIELGIDVSTADMYYFTIVRDYPYSQGKIKTIAKIMDGSFSSNYDIPAWSLSALLGLIPDKISINNETYYLSFTKKRVEFRGPITWDGQKAKTFEMDNILDAAFEMICWLKENKKI